MAIIKEDIIEPQAEVIAYTTFCGAVPQATLQSQDQGSLAGRLIEYSGRECYDSYGKGRGSDEFHQHILVVGHGSVLEHASLSFHIQGISRGCSHELVRHRAGTAISQRSTRYVDENESEWAWHPLMTATPLDEELIETIREDAQGAYCYIRERVEAKLKQRGVDALTARKQARGAARGVLGNALSTSLVWTANIRALRHVLENRAHPAADAEIRLLANRLYEAAHPYCPEYLSDYEKSDAPDGIGYCLTTIHRKV